ncbi:putative PIG3 family NAD(P)H quinone oxidoreductase [Mucilaginibacter gracilis]|uniref:Putative PIG3 family NAD(P)H quinone oxidoreductase n=1 Tax=Mucilaginibacter gracilis TaxID=423350 RepID=A0A495J9C0_9SPHI|nr:NAD(P)H-quinone oxidoreductase [Mucilaginibacter gracilis]RKR84982.1 putative PIG3 family NAD(P)H quinone oxidoreductase [Mucilaginibacter gracilis]
MKAIVITHPGAPEVLQMQERPMPTILATEILVKVAAAGVNRPDVAQRKGNYPPPPGASVDIPGLEIAGTVVEVGAQVTRWKVGDEVCALVTGAGYAGFCAVPAGQCLPVPKGLSMPEAASLPETFFTVWSNVFDRAKLQPGETLLVHGGSSGIGVTAIQMAKALGSKVYVTAGSADKLLFCQQLGAAKAINYKTENFADAIARLTDGEGVDVILDMIGGDYTPENIKCLANDGRLVQINAMKGREVKIDIAEVMRKRLIITGSTLRGRNVDFKSAIAQKLEQYIWPLLASGQIKPVVYKTFTASQAAQAHTLMESSEHMGKIVLEM